MGGFKSGVKQVERDWEKEKRQKKGGLLFFFLCAACVGLCHQQWRWAKRAHTKTGPFLLPFFSFRKRCKNREEVGGTKGWILKNEEGWGTASGKGGYNGVECGGKREV